MYCIVPEYVRSIVASFSFGHSTQHHNMSVGTSLLLWDAVWYFPHLRALGHKSLRSGISIGPRGSFLVQIDVRGEVVGLRGSRGPGAAQITKIDDSRPAKNSRGGDGECEQRWSTPAVLSLAILAQAFRARRPCRPLRPPPLVATCRLSAVLHRPAMVSAVGRFADTSPHSLFVWSSECPKTAKAALAHFRVFVKTMPPQCQVDGAKVVFTDSKVFFPWRRPATVRAAHMWAARTLKDVDFKGGTGEWTLSAAAVGPVCGYVSASMGTPLADTPPPSAIAPLPDAFPSSPSLKILRGRLSTGGQALHLKCSGNFQTGPDVVAFFFAKGFARTIDH